MDHKFMVAEVARLWAGWSGESQTLASSATAGEHRSYFCHDPHLFLVGLGACCPTYGRIVGDSPN